MVFLVMVEMGQDDQLWLFVFFKSYYGKETSSVLYVLLPKVSGRFS
jgi:hypothetical protein